MHSFELVPGFALKIEYVVDETELLILQTNQIQKLFLSLEKSGVKVGGDRILEIS